VRVEGRRREGEGKKGELSHFGPPLSQRLPTTIDSSAPLPKPFMSESATPSSSKQDGQITEGERYRPFSRQNELNLLPSFASSEAETLPVLSLLVPPVLQPRPLSTIDRSDSGVLRLNKSELESYHSALDADEGAKEEGTKES